MAPDSLPTAPAPTAPALGPRQWCVLVAWFGCTAGYCEIAILSLRRALGEPIEVDGLRYWMAPVANLVVFAAAGLVVALANALVRPRQAIAPYLFVWCALLVLANTLHVGGIHVAANALFACGLAFRVQRILVLRLDPLLAMARTMSILMLGTTVVAVAVTTAHDVAGRRAAPPSASTDPAAYNVLLIVMDTVRAESTSLCGSPVKTTPFLDSLAATGTTFDSALSTSSWTLPSHASIFTGRYPHQLSTSWTYPLSKTPPVLAEAFRASGYHTAGFAANLLYCTREFGLARGFDHYEDHLVSWSELCFHSVVLQRLANSELVRSVFADTKTLGAKTAADVNRGFLRWVDLQDRRPFFAFLNYMDAHEPYSSHPHYESGFPTLSPTNHPARWQYFKRGAQRDDPERPAPAEIAARLATYEEAIRYVDAAIEQLLGQLEARGILERTLVVVTSDHGEQFGEHQQFAHGNSLYSQETRVPLLVHNPALCPAGLRVRRPVTLRDLPRTLLGLAGVENHRGIPGYSMFHDLDVPRCLRADTSPVLSVLGTHSPENPAPLDSTPETHALLRDGYRAFRLPGDQRQLFDWQSDVGETKDLARDPAHAGKAEQLLDEMRRLVRRHE